MHVFRDHFAQFVLERLTEAVNATANQCASIQPGEGSEDRRLHVAGQYVGLLTALEIIQSYREPEDREL